MDEMGKGTMNPSWGALADYYYKLTPSRALVLI